MKYDVTIGIPVFRSVSYIGDTMASALSQTYKSIEFLIVDDGGHDGSMDIVKDLQQRHPRGADIHIITHAVNEGVSTSRNDIIDQAHGDYLYFLDSDDLMAKNAISLLMDNASRQSAEIVFGSYEKIEVSGKRSLYQYPSSVLLGPDLLASFAYRKYAGIQASACNYLVKTSLLRDRHHRFIDTDYWEDFVFTFDLVTMISRAVLLPDVTYTYLCRENSLSHYQSRQEVTKEEIMRNVNAIEHLKSTSSLLFDKMYFPHRCFCIAMTDFYVACTVLKRGSDIVPSVSSREIRSFMSHPASFRQICTFHEARLKNLSLYLLGRLPASFSVAVIWCLGKLKKLV